MEKSKYTASSIFTNEISEERDGGDSNDGKCLICLSGNLEISKAGKPHSLAPWSPGVLGKDLSVYFILKHVLELPSEQLESFLRNCPYPEEWIRICSHCTENYVDKCKRIFMELMEVQRRFVGARSELIGAMKRSILAEDTVTRRQKDNLILDISKETRHFVEHNKYSDYDANPFIVGDLLACEKLKTKVSKDHGLLPVDINGSGHSLPTYQEIPVKEEPTSPQGNLQGDNGVHNDNFPVETSFNSDQDHDAEGSVDWNVAEDNLSSDSDSTGDEKKVKKKNTGKTGASKTKRKVTCSICQKVLSSQLSLKAHMSSCHNDKRETFQCEHCSKRLTTKDGLLYHLGAAHGITDHLPFKCTFPGCGRAFCRKYQLKEHQPSHEAPQHECQICGETFKFKRSFERHVEHHQLNGSKPYACELCPVRFSWKNNLNLHVRNVHKDGAAPTNDALRIRNDFRCSKCGLTFGLRKPLQRHYQKMHGEESTEEMKSEVEIKCRECSIVFRTNLQLRQHRINIHKTHFYQCSLCDWKGDSRRVLDKHKSLHHCSGISGNKSEGFTCSICQMTFQHKFKLRVHLQIYHKGKTAQVHQCKHCNKEFVNKSILQSHLGKVHGIKDHLKFHCTFEGCGKSFHFKCQLTRHQNCHQAPCYKCEQCGKLRRTSKLLERHIERCHGQRELTRSHRCQLCPASYSWSAGLHLHMKKVHPDLNYDATKKLGDKIRQRLSLRCSECGEYFHYQKELRKHAEAVHGVKWADGKVKGTFRCSICEVILSTKSALDTHIRQVHEKRNQVCCELCGKTCYKTYMKIHMYRVHQIGNMELPKYPCTVEGCAKTYGSKSELKSHILITHKGQRPFQCDWCGKEANTRTHLRRHIEAMHTNRESKPFKCDECGKCFALKNYLWLHKKTHQPKEQQQLQKL